MTNKELAGNAPVLAEGAFTTYAQLQLPAGTYFFHGNAKLVNKDTMLLATPACGIFIGSTSGANGGGPQDMNPLEETILSATLVYNFDTTTTVLFACGEFGRQGPVTGVEVFQVQMNALPVQNVIVQ
jgi:hypothetical protein